MGAGKGIRAVNKIAAVHVALSITHSHYTFRNLPVQLSASKVAGNKLRRQNFVVQNVLNNAVLCLPTFKIPRSGWSMNLYVASDTNYVMFIKNEAGFQIFRALLEKCNYYVACYL